MEIGLAFSNNVEFVVGTCMLLLGVSYIVATESWVKYLEVLAKAPECDALIIGGVNVLFGTTVLALHWVWIGVPAIVTAVGLLILLRGIVHLFHPTWLTLKLKLMMPEATFILKISGLVICFLAGAILYDLFLQPEVQYYWMFPFTGDEGEEYDSLPAQLGGTISRLQQFV